MILILFIVSYMNESTYDKKSLKVPKS